MSGYKFYNIRENFWPQQAAVFREIVQLSTKQQTESVRLADEHSGAFIHRKQLTFSSGVGENQNIA